MIGWVRATQVCGLYVKFRTIIEAGFGVGITENIVAGLYRDRPPVSSGRPHLPDRLLARRLHGALRGRRHPALRPVDAPRTSATAPDVVRLFRMRKRRHQERANPSGAGAQAQLPAIEFLGLFDTVGSLGVPLWGWWFNWRLNSSATAVVDRSVADLRAMSITPWRWTSAASQFFPTPFDKTQPAGAWTKTLEASLVPRLPIATSAAAMPITGLADVALEWMYKAPASRTASSSKASCSRSFGPIRWPACTTSCSASRPGGCSARGRAGIPSMPTLHPSVTERAKADSCPGAARYARRSGTSPETFISGCPAGMGSGPASSSRAGARYLLTWQEGKWRDKDSPPCDPTGQAGRDFFRWLFRFRRRLPKPRTT